MDQQLLFHRVDPSLHFDNVEGLLSYIYYLTSNENALEGTPVDYDSKELLEFHKGKSVLKIDKYISCCVPAADLEFVLESQGIMNYDCFIDPEFNFKHGVILAQLTQSDCRKDLQDARRYLPHSSHRVVAGSCVEFRLRPSMVRACSANVPSLIWTFTVSVCLGSPCGGCS